VAVGADQKLRELSPFVSFLKRRVLRTVVEIGTRKGGSFFAWCQVAEPDALIVSIDLPGGAFGGGYEEADIPIFRSYAQPGQELHFLRADSHDPATRRELLTILAGRDIDFLMIDGDHTYDGVRQDFALYSPLVKRRGLIAFHDIVHHEQVPRCQVDRFWNEIKRNYRYREFVSEGEERSWGNWAGIGVLWYET
jgi:cephalosporin hydroxylase